MQHNEVRQHEKQKSKQAIRCRAQRVYDEIHREGKHKMRTGVTVQGMTFRYTDKGTLIITLVDDEQKELTPREAVALLTFLYDEQGELFKLARQYDVQNQAVSS